MQGNLCLLCLSRYTPPLQADWGELLLSGHHFDGKETWVCRLEGERHYKCSARISPTLNCGEARMMGCAMKHTSFQSRLIPHLPRLLESTRYIWLWMEEVQMKALLTYPACIYQLSRSREL